VFSRVVYGARFAVDRLLGDLHRDHIGVVMGIVAGYFGGWVDTVISRLMDLFLAFLLLLFAISLIVVATGLRRLERSTARDGSTGDHHRWLQPAVPAASSEVRLSLRANAIRRGGPQHGARSRFILFRELLPNSPRRSWSTRRWSSVNIIFEASLSFLGVGVQPPTRPGARCSPTRSTGTGTTRSS
jgi:ABC-type dipeptide/oligopeptide/nickel transport system permease subunit